MGLMVLDLLSLVVFFCVDAAEVYIAVYVSDRCRIESVVEHRWATSVPSP
jgi:hypothetical protein